MSNKFHAKIQYNIQYLSCYCHHQESLFWNLRVNLAFRFKEQIHPLSLLGLLGTSELNMSNYPKQLLQRLSLDPKINALNIPLNKRVWW